MKSRTKISLAMLSGTIIYYLLATKYLSMGNWWVNSCFSFFAGIYWASYRDKYIMFFKAKKVVIYSAVTALISAAIVGTQFLISGYTAEEIAEHTELADYVMKSPISVIFMNIISVSLMIIMFCILRKVKLNDKVFNFLGNISFELYLYHGIIMYLLRNKYCYLKYDLLYAVLVIGLSILSAKLMNTINRKIYNIYTGCLHIEKVSS